MDSKLEPVRQWLRTLVERDAQLANDAALGNLRRLRWLLPIFLLLVVCLLAIFELQGAQASSTQLAWRAAISRVYVATIAVTLVLIGLVWRMAAATVANGWIRLFQFLCPLAFLLFTVVLTVYDQWVTPNISPYLLGCVAVSLLFQLPPRAAAGVMLTAYAVFFIGLGQTQADATLLLGNRVNGFSASLLAMLIALTLWSRNAQYALLQRELTERNATLEKQQADLLWLATRDALTGLFNRGEFMRLAELELLRSRRHGGNTSIIVVDLDHFKSINDQHGHPAGDKVLAHVAACLRDGVRVTDVVARIGGEEFVVLLPQTDIDSAEVLARKLRHSVRQSKATISSELALSVTASLGVACMPGGHEGSVAALYAAADNALYEAKRKGRDRVERTEPDATLTPSDFQRMRMR